MESQAPIHDVLLELEEVLQHENRALRELDREAIEQAAAKKLELDALLRRFSGKALAGQADAELLESVRRSALANQLLLVHARSCVQGVLSMVTGQPVQRLSCRTPLSCGRSGARRLQELTDGADRHPVYGPRRPRRAVVWARGDRSERRQRQHPGLRPPRPAAADASGRGSHLRQRRCPGAEARDGRLHRTALLRRDGVFVGGVRAGTRTSAPSRRCSTTSTATGLASTLDAFFASFANLSSNPADPTVRATVLQKAQELADRMNQTSDSLSQFRVDLFHKAQGVTEQVNQKAKDLARLNEQIYQAEIQGHDAADLKDQRGQLLSGLSELIDVHTFHDKDGHLIVQAGGTTLVEKSVFRTLSVGVDTNNDLQILAAKSSGGNADITQYVSGGTLAGIRDARDADAVAILNRLDQLGLRHRHDREHAARGGVRVGRGQRTGSVRSASGRSGRGARPRPRRGNGWAAPIAWLRRRRPPACPGTPTMPWPWRSSPTRSLPAGARARRRRPTPISSATSVSANRTQPSTRRRGRR